MFFTVSLLIFAFELAWAAATISRLKSTPATYNRRLLPFAYFSLSSWIVWAFQYLILAGLFGSLPTGFFLDTGLWLSTIQNALWASAVLSLRSKQFPRISTRLPLFIIFPIVIVFALGTYRIAVLTSETFILSDGLVSFIFFTALVHSIWQWRLSRLYTAVFAIHGYSQWFWRSLWFSPVGTQCAILIAFPVWRIIFLFVWIRLISAILNRAESSYREVLGDIERFAPPQRLDTITLMIGSTVDDLVQEREATALAVERLGLTEIRAEMFGTPSEPLRNVYSFLAEGCNIFILIIGEHYGQPMEPEGISVIEFQYQAARDQNFEKILVYVKDGVIREPRLQDFLTRVEEAEHSYVRTFITPEELYEEIHRGIAQWLISQGSNNN